MIRMLLAAVAFAGACAGTAWAQEAGAPGDHTRSASEAPPPTVQPPRPDPAYMLPEDYPPSAMRAREQGAVRIAVCLNALGRVHDVRLVQSSGSTALDEATLKGAKRLRFRPALDEEGNPIEWCDPPYELTITWRLAD